MPLRGRPVKVQSNKHREVKGSSGEKGQSPHIAMEKERQQNPHAPVSRLPPELVLCVFKYLKDAVTLESKNYVAIKVKRYEWLKLTHVFHSWREIALFTPSLWSDIRITRRDYKWPAGCYKGLSKTL